MTMRLFDSHAHIGLIHEDPIEQLIVVQEAKREKVEGIISICNNLRDFFQVYENLRTATQTQNNRNRRKFNLPTKSKYKGVYWKQPIKKWVAQIGVNKKIIHLGCFKKQKAAAKAYDKAAKKYHGEFACLNFKK